MRSLLYIVLLVCSLAYSCSSGSEAVVIDQYYSLKAILQKVDETRLTLPAVKTVHSGSREERQEDQAYPLYLDIRAFEMFDINRPALYGKYSVDTLHPAPDEVTIIYLAQSADLKVKELRVTSKGPNPQSVYARAQSQSVLESVDFVLDWQLPTSYTLRQSMVRRLGDTSHFEVKVMYQSPVLGALNITQ